jgi:hypothetical protein
MSEQTVTVRRQLWEYRSCTKQSETYLVQELNEAGKEGWDLAAAAFSKDLKGNWAWTAILKRPLEAPARQATAAPAAKSSAAPVSAAKPPASPPAKGDSQGFDLSGDEFGFKSE